MANKRINCLKKCEKERANNEVKHLRQKLFLFDTDFVAAAGFPDWQDKVFREVLKTAYHAADAIERLEIENADLRRRQLVISKGDDEQPDEPLTLGELRQMCGQPVWCSEIECWGIVVIEEGGHWDGVTFLLGYEGCKFLYDVGSRQLTLYRRKPEQERKDE